jgi:hypothetical protein
MKREPRVSEPACDRTQWDWVYIGRCRVCGTSVRADDEFVRRPEGTVHTECDRQGFIERAIE